MSCSLQFSFLFSMQMQPPPLPEFKLLCMRCDPIYLSPLPAQKCRNKSRFRASFFFFSFSCSEEERSRVILRVGTGRGRRRPSRDLFAILRPRVALIFEGGRGSLSFSRIIFQARFFHPLYCFSMRVPSPFENGMPRQFVNPSRTPI